MKRLNIEKLEAETVETRWDIKRILIGLVIVAFLVSLGALMLFPNDQNKKTGAGGTLGISSDTNQANKELPSLPIKEDIEKILVEAQNTLSQITSENLTSSQGAIQKLISDLEKLKEKNEPIDIICDLVCKDK